MTYHSDPLLPGLEAPIFLTGFMACGKSTVGQALADLLGRPFLDLDARIEAITNRSIPDLIASEGEERFRQLEHETLCEAARLRNTIIALGGGTIMRADNRGLMQEKGITIWLDVPFDVCWERIRQDSAIRPLAPDEKTARELYEQRQPFYQMANIRTDVSQPRPAAEIAETILQQLVRYGGEQQTSQQPGA